MLSCHAPDENIFELMFLMNILKIETFFIVCLFKLYRVDAKDGFLKKVRLR